jgi:hypothetical protein
VPAADNLAAILPDPADPVAFDAFVDSASADDLALAAALILAGEAKKVDNLDIFNDHGTVTIPPESQGAVDFAEALATAALDKPSTGNSSNLLDLLGQLGFTPTPTPP